MLLLPLRHAESFPGAAIVRLRSAHGHHAHSATPPGATSSLTAWNTLADHLSPILLVFVPLYRIAATPLWFFAAQAIAAGFGVLCVRPLAIAAGLRAESAAAHLLVVGVAVSPAVWNAMLYDFHTSTLALPAYPMVAVLPLTDKHVTVPPAVSSPLPSSNPTGPLGLSPEGPLWASRLNEVGPVAVLSPDGDAPLLPGLSNASPQTQRVVDEEVRRLVEDAHREVAALLQEHRSQLDGSPYAESNCGPASGLLIPN